MTSTSKCLCFLTRLDATGRREVLLGYKKRGIGVGKIVGLGGHIEVGETAIDATVREVAEESSLRVEPTDLREVAAVSFRFPTRPGWNMEVAVFLGDRFTGEARECDEIAPHWYPVDDLPFHAMWDDNPYWLPQVLAGRRLKAAFEFAADCETVETSRIDPAPAAP